MKRLERTPASLPPPNPGKILLSLPWLSGLNKEIVLAIQEWAQFIQLEQGDTLSEEEVKSTGIYIIISGLVKVCVSCMYNYLHIYRYVRM